MRKTSGLSHYQDRNHCNSKMRQGSNTFAQSGKSLDACGLQKLTAIRIVTDQGFWQEKAMAPHSSTLAWKIPWTEEPRGLQSLGSQRVGHDWATSLSLFTFHALEKEFPLVWIQLADASFLVSALTNHSHHTQYLNVFGWHFLFPWKSLKLLSVTREGQGFYRLILYSTGGKDTSLNSLV